MDASGNPLSFTDLIRSTSPSPATPPSTQPQAPIIALPDVLDIDRIKMRDRVIEMGLAAMSPESSGANSTPRERELADMIFRLTASAPPDSAQLVYQADTISKLIEQREYLLRQAEDQRARWESERENWNRIAEAMVARRTKTLNAQEYNEQLARQWAVLDSENRILLHRLMETRACLLTLETELAKLRPVLLMQPYSSTSTHHRDLLYVKRGRGRPRNHKRQPPAGVSPVHPEASKKSLTDAGREADQDAEDGTEKDTDKEGMKESESIIDNGSAMPGPNTSRRTHRSPSQSYYRLPEIFLTADRWRPATYKEPKPTNPPSQKPGVPLLSDARIELVLTAARQIGMERAAIIAGMVERERVEKVEDKKRETKLARKNANAQNSTWPAGPSTQPGPSLVYMNYSPPTPQPPQQQPPPTPFLTTPHTTGPPPPPTPTPQRHPTFPDINPGTPSTPLASLLSAAESMESLNGQRGRRQLEPPESPSLPKRRKVTTGGVPAVQAANGLARVRTALDVLADQAAAFSSKEAASSTSETPRGVGPSLRVPPEVRDKGKAKEKEKDRPANNSNTKKAKGKPRASRGKGKHKESEPEPEPEPEIDVGYSELDTWDGTSPRPKFPFSPLGPPPSLRPVSVWGARGGPGIDADPARTQESLQKAVDEDVDSGEEESDRPPVFVPVRRPGETQAHGLSSIVGSSRSRDLNGSPPLRTTTLYPSAPHQAHDLHPHHSAHSPHREHVDESRSHTPFDTDAVNPGNEKENEDMQDSNLDPVHDHAHDQIGKATSATPCMMGSRHRWSRDDDTMPVQPPKFGQK